MVAAMPLIEGSSRLGCTKARYQQQGSSQSLERAHARLLEKDGEQLNAWATTPRRERKRLNPALTLRPRRQTQAPMGPRLISSGEPPGWKVAVVGTHVLIAVAIAHLGARNPVA